MHFLFSVSATTKSTCDEKKQKTLTLQKLMGIDLHHLNNHRMELQTLDLNWVTKPLVDLDHSALSLVMNFHHLLEI